MKQNNEQGEQLFLATHCSKEGDKEITYFKEIYGDKEFIVESIVGNTRAELTDIWKPIQDLVDSPKPIVTFFSWQAYLNTYIYRDVCWEARVLGLSNIGLQDGIYNAQRLSREYLNKFIPAYSDLSDDLEDVYELLFGYKLTINNDFSRAIGLANLMEEMHLGYINEAKSQIDFLSLLHFGYGKHID